MHDDAFYAGIAAQYADCPDIDRAYIKDPAGILTPDRARTLIPAVRGGARRQAAGAALARHARAVASSPAWSPPSWACRCCRSGAAPSATARSLPDAEQLVANLRASGHTVDVDDRLLAAVARYFDRLAAAEGLPPGQPGAFDAAFMDHQLAGGIMSTTRRQLPRSAWPTGSTR